MKTAIRYYSKFGHSKQMAQAIAEIAKAEPLTVEKPLNETFDILFLGAGIFLGSVNKSVIQFINTLTPDKVGCVVLFGSSALIGEPTKGMREALTKRGVKVYDKVFECKGAMGPIGSGHPDKQDMKALQDFVREIVK